MTRKPAAVFPPAEYLRDELTERGWTLRDLAERMGGDPILNECGLELMLALPEKNMILDVESAAGLEHALGSSAQFWLNLDATWRAGTPEQRKLGLTPA